MDLQLTGNRALITGASKGIGLATARALAGEGCDLVLVARGEEDLKRVKGELAEQYATAVEIEAADLTIDAMSDRLAERFPEIDILVNNAGAIPGGSLLQIDDQTWRKAWDLKVFGYISMCRSYYEIMKKKGAGTIINIVGNASDTRDPDYICGVAGNAALAAFTQALGSTSWQDGIRVLAINPGPVATDRMINMMRGKLEAAGESVPDDENLFAKLPFGRAASPQEIASAVAFLVSEKSGYASGSIMTIDAGLSVRGSFA